MDSQKKGCSTSLHWLLHRRYLASHMPLQARPTLHSMCWFANGHCLWVTWQLPWPLSVKSESCTINASSPLKLSSSATPSLTVFWLCLTPFYNPSNIKLVLLYTMTKAYTVILIALMKFLLFNWLMSSSSMVKVKNIYLLLQRLRRIAIATVIHRHRSLTT